MEIKKLWKLKTTVYGLCDTPKSCLQQDMLRVNMMMQHSIGIKKAPYNIFFLHMPMTFVGQEQTYFKTQ